MTNLTNNQIVFSVNGSFFSEKSHLIAVYILALIGNKIVIQAKFITIVALEYHYSYAAELCGSLGIFVILDKVVPRKLRGKIQVSISTNYQVVIDVLYGTHTIIQFNTRLYQIC